MERGPVRPRQARALEVPDCAFPRGTVPARWRWGLWAPTEAGSVLTSASPWRPMARPWRLLAGGGALATCQGAQRDRRSRHPLAGHVASCLRALVSSVVRWAQGSCRGRAPGMQHGGNTVIYLMRLLSTRARVTSEMRAGNRRGGRPGAPFLGASEGWACRVAGSWGVSCARSSARGALSARGVRVCCAAVCR